MPISLQELIDEISVERTVLIFGAGASIPSNAPSVSKLIQEISDEFKIEATGLNLREIAGLAENKRNRHDLIKTIRRQFRGLKPQGALLNLPLYPWKSIYTTNYDQLVEDSYLRGKKPIKSYSSNFDFTADTDLGTTKLFKIHGTIDKDVADGHASRMILTDLDYDATSEFRETLYDRLKADIDPGTSVVIIGQSLADEDLRDVVQRAISINQKAKAAGRISLLLYQRDENRAKLFELRGIRIVFGGLDDFFNALGLRFKDSKPPILDTTNPLDFITRLRPITIDLNEEIDVDRADVSAIFSGWAATYADISRGFTFDRTVASDIVQYFSDPSKLCAILLGASGVGKTSAARQAMLRLRGQGYLGFEHKIDHPISAENWLSLALRLKSNNERGALFIDEAHSQLFELNTLVDMLVIGKCQSLKLIIVSTRNHWGPRVKTPNMYAFGKEFQLSQLSSREIDLLLAVVETVPEMRVLVEQGFGGFSKHERRRRLVERCEADMFVCLKNIFASEKFDDIILREYGTLSLDSQEIYKWVSAMEHSGIRVHRQLVMRILNVDANAISGILSNLADIVSEYNVNVQEGVYGWKIRHYVIAGIISKYKFYEMDKIIDLFLKVIDNISPTFEIEIMTIRQLCNMESGISTIPDRSIQNTLFRKMMSIAPGERIPRHRLIRNLIESGEFEKAESEIRIFEKDFGKDASITRYRISLMIARASGSNGLLYEDRLVIFTEARELAVAAVTRFNTNKYVMGIYCELGIEIYKLTRQSDIFEEGLAIMKKAENRLGDPEVTKMMVKYQRRFSSHVNLNQSTGEKTRFLNDLLE
jgi:SIR2-like domain